MTTPNPFDAIEVEASRAALRGICRAVASVMIPADPNRLAPAIELSPAEVAMLTLPPIPDADDGTQPAIAGRPARKPKPQQS